MTNEHSNEAALGLAPPLAEWPDEAYWWAVDIIRQKPRPSFWTAKPIVLDVAEDDRCEAWARLEPVHEALRSPGFENGRFWKSAPAVTLPPGLDWRDTLVSRADMEQWEAEQDAKRLWEMTDAEIREVAHKDASWLVLNWLAEKRAEQAEQGAPAHGWTDERIDGVLGRLWYDTSVVDVLRRCRDDVEAHYEQRVAGLERKVDILQWANENMSKMPKRIAELEQERDSYRDEFEAEANRRIDAVAKREEWKEKCAELEALVDASESSRNTWRDKAVRYGEAMTNAHQVVRQYENLFGTPAEAEQAAELWRLRELVRESDKYIRFCLRPKKQPGQVSLHIRHSTRRGYFDSIPDAIAWLEAETQQPEPELLQCPFCGGTATIDDVGIGGMLYVDCDGCNVVLGSSNRDKLVAEWNQRTPHGMADA